MSKFTGFSQVKIGALFSYILIIANTLYTLVITPMVLSVLGSADYGVYMSMASLSSSLMVLDLGIGGTLMRYISKFKADKEDNKIGPFVSMAMSEAFALAIIALIVCAVFYFNISRIYSSSFTGPEIALAKTLFLILTANVLFHIIENVFNGIITGHNNFIFGNGIKIIRIALRVSLMFVLFFKTKSAITLALIDLSLTIFLAITELIYVTSVYNLKIRISFLGWDKVLFRESFIYTGLVFLTSVVGQIEGNFANVVIGAYRGPQFVTIYSFGLTIFQMFRQLSSSISGVMLPTVTNTLRLNDGLNKSYNLSIKIGRIQFSLLGAVLVGFIVLGKQFLVLWLGEGFNDVYIIVLIIMVPALMELCVNTCLSILRAKNMLSFYTIIACISAVLNLIITIIGVKYVSYIFAAVGTATSSLFGYVIIMGIYYYKTFKFNVINMYYHIFKRIWICILISGFIVSLCTRVIIGGWGAFFANVFIFIIVYFSTLLLYGWTKEEKRNIPILNKFL